MPVINKAQVKELLGTGLSVSVVASAVGCTDSYITQLLSDEEFAAEVAQLKVVNLQAASKRDSSINSLEDKILLKLGRVIDENAIYKPRDLLSAFAIINRASRRGSQSPHETGIPTTTIINLNLPSAIAKRFTINSQGEVLQVDDQTLVTMPTGQLLRNLAEQQAEKLTIDQQAKTNYQQVRNKLLVDLREGKKEGVGK